MLKLLPLCFMRSEIVSVRPRKQIFSGLHLLYEFQLIKSNKYHIFQTTTSPYNSNNENFHRHKPLNGNLRCILSFLYLLQKLLAKKKKLFQQKHQKQQRLRPAANENIAILSAQILQRYCQFSTCILNFSRSAFWANTSWLFFQYSLHSFIRTALRVAPFESTVYVFSV